MIKVTVGKQKTQSEKPFPKLMKWNGEKIIIALFKNKEFATILKSDSTEWSVGDYDNYFDMKQWADYNEPITLQNA